MDTVPANKGKQKTTILLANDHHVVRQGIRQLLEREVDFKVVGEAENGLEAVRLTRELKPDIIVMEPYMAKLGGVEAIRRIKVEHPQAAVLILTMYDKEDYIVELLATGAAGYLLKTAYSEQLVEAVRSVGTGDFVCSSAVMQKLLKHITRAHVAVDFGERLTRRQLDILEMVAKGLSNREIASCLGLTEGTVKGYFVTIFGKMRVGSRTEAVLKAIRLGWLSTEDERTE